MKQTPQLIWQHSPTKSQVANYPAKECETSSGFYSPQTPSFRFLCPSCGSLDVFATKTSQLDVQCLDCSAKWSEDRI